MSHTSRLPLGIKVILGFHLVSIVLWIVGQGGAVVSYDTVAEWGFHDPRQFLDPVIVEVNRAIGLADIIVQMPLFILAVIGLWRCKFYGAVASWLVFGITLYWPVVFWCSQFFYNKAGIVHKPTELPVTLILIVILLFTAWASWYLYLIFDRISGTDRSIADSN